VNSKYTKHIAIAFHHAREDVVHGNVDLKYIPSADNVADIFTKALAVPTFLRLKELIPVAWGSSVIAAVLGVSSPQQGEVLDFLTLT
jgi:hypothetical protein